jgi:phage gp36-like protein
MSYASLEDLIERAGETEILQIADRDHDDVADPDVIDAALVHADNIVNGHVGVKYYLPLASTPDLVRTWSVSIARYFLHRNGAPDYVETDYKTAISSLKDVARGLISLPDATGAVPAATAGVHMADSPDQVFSPENLRGWK